MKCSLPDCKGVAKAQGFCFKHYMRRYRQGVVGGVRTPMAKRIEAIEKNVQIILDILQKNGRNKYKMEKE